MRGEEIGGSDNDRYQSSTGRRQDHSRRGKSCVSRNRGRPLWWFRVASTLIIVSIVEDKGETWTLSWLIGTTEDNRAEVVPFRRTQYQQVCGLYYSLLVIANLTHSFIMWCGHLMLLILRFEPHDCSSALHAALSHGPI